MARSRSSKLMMTLRAMWLWVGFSIAFRANSQRFESLRNRWPRVPCEHLAGKGGALGLVRRARNTKLWGVTMHVNHKRLLEKLSQRVAVGKHLNKRTLDRAESNE